MIDHLLTTIPVPVVYLLTALVVGIESIGIPLPGEIVIVAAALMASRHELEISPHGVAAAAVAGAIVGDGIGYLVGRRFGDRVFGWLGKRFPSHVNDDTVAYAEHVFGKYGMLAVFFGRFIALLRMFAGPLAGSLKMPPWKFFPANVAGAVLWAGGTAYLVYYLGAAADKWLKNFSYVGLAVAAVVALLLSTVLRRAVNRRVNAFAEQRRADAQRQPSS